MTRFSAPIAEQIWDMKYRLKDADGTPVDATVEDTWRRIARALAASEKDPSAWEDRFYAALEDFRFLPAGRIVAGAGTGRSVTLFNCFVMGTIPDSMSGIFDGLKEAALTMQQGGGIGYDFSTIRPRGADVKGVAADASGPLSFMDVWDAMCRTIMSAGSRRGAMMATMRCDHPDIEEFITAKSDPARLRNFNVSVLVTDPFMEAVKSDASWDLVFDGKVYRTVQARDLWNRIMRATFDYAEPGVIFIDRINAMNNLSYVETIAATNPCVTADTWVQTDAGPEQVRDLVGKPFRAVVNGTVHESGPEGFFPTGRKRVLRLTTSCGRSLRLTADHKILAVSERTRWRTETEWRAAGDLRPGDEVMLHDHRSIGLGNAEPENERGYLLGLLIGDGTIREDKTLLSVWPERACVGAPPPEQAVMDHAEALIRTLPHRADFAGWQAVPATGEYRMTTAALRDLATSYGLARGRKTLTPEIERAPAAFGAAVLRGLFDADGSVQGTTDKGVSVRLAQSDPGLLEAAQRMLLRLGINAVIYSDRRRAGETVLPDGKGGAKPYPVKAQHELVIANENLAVFAERVGFSDTAKAARLAERLSGYARALNRERFFARIEEVVPDGEADVFDVQVPGVNAFDANGLVVHNCGEQPLPPYGACLLGSINLARLVTDPFTETAAIDADALAELVGTAVRMMDNVVDASRFPLPEQAEEARQKRRIGLGVTGLADALLMTGLRYGSDEAAAQTEAWIHAVARAAYLASADLAAEKGAFPLYDRDAYLASGSLTHMDADVRDAIAEKGIRNALLTSIAPTGTISLYAGNVSSGIEPVFAYAYTRKVLQKDGTRTEEEVVDYAVRLWRDLHGDAPLPEHFVNAQTLQPADHVKMQAAAQKWVDSSISKTINCPEDIGFEAFKDVYMQAYETGCKGCTTYRPNAVTGSVLSVAEAPNVAPPELADPGERLVWALDRRGISQTELAKKLRIADATVSNFRHGKRGVSNDLAEKIAEALGIDAGWLIFGTRPASGDSSAPAPAPGTIAARIEAAAAAVGIGDIPTLADRAGIEPDTIAAWDDDTSSGGRKPTNRDARAVAEVLGVTPRWLLFGEGEGPEMPAAPEVVSVTEDEPRQPHGDVVYISEPLDRPQALDGATYKLKWPDSNHAIYITINDLVVGGHRRPFEVFINSKNMEHFAWTVALTRMISAVFRRGGDVSFVVEELKAVFDPRGGAWMNGKYVPSILAAIGGVIERHMIAIGFLAGEGMGLKSDPRAQVVNLTGGRGAACPACGQYDMRMVEGCMTCGSCGHSKCS